jgi:hypothetical protein
MKKALVLLFLVAFLVPSFAQAALTTIGTASYMGSDYNLIWDDNNNGNSLVWLDYTNGATNWSAQTDWAASLDTALTYNIDAQYSVTWAAGWRLPDTVDGVYSYGTDGTTTGGYNITSSELGHLFYEELGNLGQRDTSGNSQSGYGLSSTGDFDYLVEAWYWSGTEYAANTGDAWGFYTGFGNQQNGSKSVKLLGLAVCNAQVSAVPVPGAIWLLGSCLLGSVGFRRFKK